MVEEHQVQYIPIDKLEIDDANIRTNIQPDDDLIESIENQGILEPLIIRPYNEKYGIVSGSRRYSAALHLDLKTLPCIVRDLDDIEARAISISENRHREDIPGWRWEEVISELFEDLDGGASRQKRVEKINKLTGLSKTTVKDYLQISELPPDIKARMKKPSERSDSEKKQLESVSVLTGDKELPKQVAIKIARESDFESWNKEKQHAVVTQAAKVGQNRVDEVLEAVKRHPDDPVEEAFKKKVKVPKATPYKVQLGAKLSKALDKYSTAIGETPETTIRDIVKERLEKEGYYDKK